MTDRITPLRRTCDLVQAFCLCRHIEESTATIFTATIPYKKINAEIIALNCYIKDTPDYISENSGAEVSRITLSSFVEY